jgi:hypothetical protein
VDRRRELYEDIFTHLTDASCVQPPPRGTPRGLSSPRSASALSALEAAEDRQLSSTRRLSQPATSSPAVPPPAGSGERDGGWWTQRREHRRRQRAGSPHSTSSRGSASRPSEGDAGDAGEDVAAEVARQEGERLFTCTVGRKRSQARYYLNDSEEVALLLARLCETLPKQAEGS